MRRSNDIREIGWKIWKYFTKEIQLRNVSSPLRHVCMKQAIVANPKEFIQARVGRVLHVTYKENAAEVKKELMSASQTKSQT